MNNPDLLPPSDASADVTRAQPHAVGPEKSILSSMLVDPNEYIGEAVEAGLTDEAFYLPAHGTLFIHIQKLWQDGQTIELVSLVQSLLDAGKLDHVGGSAGVTDIFTYAPTAGHFHHHLKMVMDKHLLRSMIAVCTETITEAFSEPGDAKALLDHAETRLASVRDGMDRQPKEQSTRQVIAEIVEEFGQVAMGQESLNRGLTTGFERLDAMSQGLNPGDMFVIAARPSMGKTAIMMDLIDHICMVLNEPAMVFSVEMTKKQLLRRALFSRAKYSPARLRYEKPTKGDLIRIQRSAQEVAESKLFVDDVSGITINELRAKARRKHREHGIKAIAIDYLQLMRSGSKQAQNSREREIAEISAGLKGLAKELGVPVIVLAQLNRDSEKRGGKTKGLPRMSDLRESGSIEQDADMVGLLHRDDYFAETEEERCSLAGKARLILAKNRNGETGEIPLTFVAEHMRYETRRPEEGF